MSRRVTAAAAAALATAVLAGCATTVDPEIAGDTTTARSDGSTTTTVFAATGTTEELLDQLLDQAHTLSEAIVDNRDQHDVIARIDVIWEAVRPAVDDTAPNLMLEFERAMVMLHTAVDRRRPADADKAYTNLVNLVAAFP